MKEFRITASIEGKPAKDFIIEAETETAAMDALFAMHAGQFVEIFVVYELS